MEPPMDPMMAGGALTPEQVQAFMEYAVNQGAFTEQDRAVQQQLAIANELRNRQGTPHTTGIGGGLGAIGGFLRNIAGARQMGQAQEQDRALQQARIAALRKLASGFGAKPLPGYDAASGTLADQGGSGGAYIMPGPLYR